MTKYRKLHTRIIESDDFNSMPDDFTRLTWTLLMLILDREGRALDNLSNLRAKIYPLRDDVTINMIKKAFDWYAENALIVRYSVNGRNYFYQKNFAKYQGDTSREGYSIYPEPPGYQPPEIQAEDEQYNDSEVDQEESEDKSIPTQELVKTNSRPTQDLVMSNSCSSSYSASDSSSALDSASSSECARAAPEPIPIPSQEKPDLIQARKPNRPPPLPPSHPPGDRDLSQPEIYELNHRSYAIWEDIIKPVMPDNHDADKIALWGKLFGYHQVIQAFEAARDKYNTLPEIYNSINGNSSVP